jgi:hypothetical protein
MLVELVQKRTKEYGARDESDEHCTRVKRIRHTSSSRLSQRYGLADDRVRAGRERLKGGLNEEGKNTDGVLMVSC